MPDQALERTYREIPLRTLSGEALEGLSTIMRLSLSRADMEAIQTYFLEARREPTDVELEVIAQTWSEHCKHRIFGALIRHRIDGREETVDGLFQTYIKAVSERIRRTKPDFVLSAFVDNAGFIRLDAERAVCLKAETHNHPSAIEPYAGANTGLGGVIRDILGAGKGAKPIGSFDVFCFGSPDTPAEAVKAPDVIHPLGILRGVVRGVRDYGNRMGIPTVAGAIQFDPAYIYNPLVFCGTAGVIPIADIPKKIEANMLVIAVGGRTGRDGLHGATFSSTSLTTDSHEEDQQAVQIGNPIEEKKLSDFVLAARERGLIEFITDCGAGGFSSAAGEMLSETGGELYLERVPLKEPGLLSWEIFLSESQERMVLAAHPSSLPALEELAAVFETELFVLGHADGSSMLKVRHDGELVCELDCRKLHDAPRRTLQSRWDSPKWDPLPDTSRLDPAATLEEVIADLAVVSREPVIREYDHEVQGNTFLKPLAGAAADAPQDGAVLRIDGSDKLMAISVSLLPEWGKTDPFAMGAACVDECVRQLVLCGSHQDQIAILDNFCLGNPNAPEELGALVEVTKGMAEAAEAYQTPFISGKDSFYNFFETEEGPVSIPVTLLVSGAGIIESANHIVGSSVRRTDSRLYLVGKPDARLGGSVLARRMGWLNLEVPHCELSEFADRYRRYHKALIAGSVLSAHDVSEGGLAVTLAEMAFSMRAGLDIELPPDADRVPWLFSESPGRFVVEVPSSVAAQFESLMEHHAQGIGSTSSLHANLDIDGGNIRIPLPRLKHLWKNGLTPYY